MADTRKIFVGSSSEGQKVAKFVEKVIEEAGMVPLPWYNKFPAGDVLLEEIERLPNEVDGAVLVATPDISCERKGKRSFRAPVGNVVFEYGFLAARLTRRRVAIVMFEGAELPSDVQGVMFVRVGHGGKHDSLPEDAKEKLRRWLVRLPRLAEGIRPISRVHGYSGRWEVQNRFSHWQGIELAKNDKVYFAGTTFLVLSADGEKGSGTQSGNLYIYLENYSNKYEIANEILAAAVDEDGILKMRVQVLSREPIPGQERGKPPDAPFSGDLLGSKTFDLELKPEPHESKRLRGTHEYRVANRVYSRAEEDYRYFGL